MFTVQCLLTPEDFHYHYYDYSYRIFVGVYEHKRVTRSTKVNVCECNLKYTRARMCVFTRYNNKRVKSKPTFMNIDVDDDFSSSALFINFRDFLPLHVMASCQKMAHAMIK